MQFGLLLVLMVFASLLEIVSIGAIVPFLAVLIEPGKVFNNPGAQIIITFLDIRSPAQLLLPLTIAFAVAAIVAGGVRLLLTWASTRLSFAVGADLSIDIYRRTLYQPYTIHVARNSSEVINGILTKVNGVIYGNIAPVLTLLSSLLILAAILCVLLSIDPLISIVAFGVFGAIYGLIIWGTRTLKIRNSHRIAYESTQVVKSLQEGLGGIRDVLIDGCQEIYCQIYGSADQTLRRAQGSNQFVSQAPRYGLEALGILLIAFLAYILAQQPEGIGNAIPMLGVLALAAQKMLPVMQQAYASWSSILGGKASLKDTLDLLDQPLPSCADMISTANLSFENVICLKGVSYRYSPEGAWVIKDVTLDIAKGARIGFIGETGSGKSTLLDLVMALLTPTEGVFEVDGTQITAANTRAWQKHIAHVPQAIFLSDGTIEENIAFGQVKSKIDRQRVVQAARQAQISETIERLPNKYDAWVGERGVRLSGGQRQRIGIARALYKKANVIIFDEATSALDNETENAVMEAIEGLGKDLTVLIIAHRLTTLKSCTQIVELADGGVRRICSYEDILVKA